MMHAVVGLLIIVGYIWAVRTLYRKYDLVRKKKFESTNSAGVLEFATYEDSKKFEREETFANLGFFITIFPGCFLFLLGIALFFAGISG